MTATVYIFGPAIIAGHTRIIAPRPLVRAGQSLN
jgi:hypothetical protein